MLFKKRNLYFLIILVVIVGIFAGLIIRSYFSYPKNQFGILGREYFCLTHLFNVNGVVGAEKTDFTRKERREIMDFLGSLSYKEPLPPQTETIYGVPIQLKVSKQDGSKLVFSFYTNVEVIAYDKDGNILNQSIYTTSKEQTSNINGILGIIED